jgi:alkylation response protein AidB-like acyl-CoA dehydrogenase
MALNQLVDSRDVRFVLFEMLECENLLKLEAFKDFDRETFIATYELAEQLATGLLYQANIAGDKTGAVYDPETKRVKVPEIYQAAWRAYREAGFPSLVGPSEWGGMGMPELVWKSCVEVIMAAGVPLSMYSTLSIGAYQLILRYGSAAMKETYLEKMISGQWSGTMCLTENTAGSDVGVLKTKAVRQPDGTFRITGQKIFITSGEHDLCENIIHPVLARIEGDPEGSKGISIFIVPKFLVNGDGSLGPANDMTCSGIEHKMGLRGSPTCSLNFGDQGECVGYLLGEERQGMKIMFEMMNSARLEVAYQGLATSSTAYMHAVQYARNRIQGYDLSKRDGKSVAIIDHPDVKRMLLWMKSYCEAMRALTHLGALQYDLMEHGSGEQQDDARALLDFIIPICKAGNSDNAWLITAEAIQVYGGYGYCAEYPIEQMARDSKIYSLYEGTNGIQSLDLLMRKLLMDPGQHNYQVFKKHILATLQRFEGVLPEMDAERLRTALIKMDDVVSALAAHFASHKVHKVLAQAVPMQKAFKLLCYAWMHTWSLGLTLPKVASLTGDLQGPKLIEYLKNSAEAAYYHGRVRSARYFLQSEFHQYDALLASILSDEDEVWQISSAEFSGALL